MNVRIFIGDIDEFKCDAVPGDSQRWAVWVSDQSAEKLIGRFDTEAEAVSFAEGYDVGPDNTKVII